MSESAAAPLIGLYGPEYLTREQAQKILRYARIRGNILRCEMDVANEGDACLALVLRLLKTAGVTEEKQP